MNPSPGPWRLNRIISDGAVRYSLRDSGSAEVFSLRLHEGVPNPMMPADNIAIIACAPEMREMLLKLEWQYDDEYDMDFCAICNESRKRDSRSKKPLAHAHDCPLGALLERLR